MKEIYVVDTSAVISYFADLLKGSDVSVSKTSLDIIDKGFYSNDVKLIFPVTVFIELFKKWFRTEEDAERIKTEIYFRISERENMEIQPFDKEILENFTAIIDIEPNHNFDNHDKQILAAAITMNCSLITSDKNVIRYNNRKKVIAKILS